MVTRIGLWLTFAAVLFVCAFGHAEELNWTQWDSVPDDGPHEYAIVRVEAPLADQQAIAEANSAYLATITSQAEKDFVKSLTLADYLSNKSINQYYWFGLIQDPTGEEPAGGWGWGTGEALDFTSWGFSRPENFIHAGGIEEDYGAVHCALGVWNDVPPHLAMRAVLEREVAVAKDVTPPTLKLHGPDPSVLTPPNGLLAAVQIAGAAVDDASGVAHAWLVVEDEYGAGGVETVPLVLGDDGTFTTSIDLVAACTVGDADGRVYTISLRAEDAEGNGADPVSQTVVVPPDTTLPSATLDSPEPSALWPPQDTWVVTISGQATDAESGISSATLVVEDEYGEFSTRDDVTGILDELGCFTTDVVVGGRVPGSDANGRAYIIYLIAVDNFGNEIVSDSVTILATSPRRDSPGPPDSPPGRPADPGNGPKKK